MSDTLTVTKRTERGTKRTRRARAAGLVPAVLYGHGEPTVSLTIPSEQVMAAVRHGSLVVDLKGDETGKAQVKGVQWGPFGIKVLHLDLARVDLSETIELTVRVDLHGYAPGVSEGGIVQHQLHELTIHCQVSSVVEHIEVNINNLHLNQQILVKDLQLPSGVTVDEDPEAVVVQCVVPKAEVETLPGEGAAEPEIIGRAAEEEESDES